MREAELERKVAEWCKRHGLLTYKFTSPSSRGVPDRLVICTRNGCILFLELKQRGARPTTLQLHEMDRLRDAGCNARWADDFDECVRILTEFCPQSNNTNEN
jgi:hypothetical protein